MAVRSRATARHAHLRKVGAQLTTNSLRAPRPDAGSALLAEPTGLAARADAFARLRPPPDELALLHARVAHRFGRPEPRRRALAYLRGLGSLRGDRNGVALASAAGETRPDGMQRLLTAAGWDADLVRDDLLGYVRERYAHASAALVVDEVVLPGRGPSFAGSTPRYAESGRVESCQVAVMAAYHTPAQAVLVDRELCLPSPWDTDRRLRRAAGIPDEHHRHTGWELAGEIVDRSLRRLPVRWVVLGAAFGPDDRLRTWLARREVAFVAPVGPGTVLGTTAGRRITAAGLPTLVGDLRWAAVGAAGASWPGDWSGWATPAGPRPPRPGVGADGGERWAQLRIRPARDGRWEHRLLLRAAAGGATGVRYYACHVPRGTTLDELVDASRRGGAVQRGVSRARATVGLDAYRVRSWTGWYRHATLALLADAAAAAHRPAA
ncbi:transposase [Frankia canadensis]|uniref:Transposase n=1 Tax=Frankia canadensis TaxID=1836972 RepID=A0A2I2KVF4_9ACTN|nr:transposase [Frankia canadensis]SOU56930.1 transposase [Frankia canadensis]